MPASKVMHGARAKVAIYQPGENIDTAKFIGIFHNVSYGVVYDVQPAFTLGRYTAAALEYTGADVVTINATGWRVFKHGWHVDGQLPLVQNLLTQEYLTFIIYDRQAELEGDTTPAAVVHQVRCTSGSGGFANRQLSEVNLTYVGILTEQDGLANSEHPTATDLP